MNKKDYNQLIAIVRNYFYDTDMFGYGGTLMWECNPDLPKGLIKELKDTFGKKMGKNN